MEILSGRSSFWGGVPSSRPALCGAAPILDLCTPLGDGALEPEQDTVQVGRNELAGSDRREIGSVGQPPGAEVPTALRRRAKVAKDPGLVRGACGHLHIGLVGFVGLRAPASWRYRAVSGNSIRLARHSMAGEHCLALGIIT